MTTAPARAGRWADVVGLALVGSLAAWAVLVSGGGGGRVASFVALLAGLVAAVAAGRALTARNQPVAAGIAGAVLATVVLTYPGIRSAAGAPTGYANANATLTAVAALAAVGEARAAPPGGRRQAWVLVTVLLGGATALTGSVAGTAGLAVAVALLIVFTTTERSHLLPAAGLIAVVLAAALTGSAAVDDAAWLGRSDEVRLDLWQAGVDLARHEPITGLGVGAFEERNPLTPDDDLRWVHHEYVELAVEVGAVGLLLTFAIAGWTAACLWLGTGPARSVRRQRSVTAAAAATVIGLHGTVDHVWHAPAPIVLTALLIGAATVDPASGQGLRRSAAKDRCGGSARAIAPAARAA